MTAYFNDKQPSESFNVDFDFSPAMDSGDTIASAITVATDTNTQEVVTSTIIAPGRQLIDNQRVYEWVQGGIARHSYLLTCQIVTTLGGRYELDGILPVVDDPDFTAINCTNFINQFPAFVNSDVTMIDTYLALSSSILNESAWGTQYQRGVFLRTAHQLAMFTVAGTTPTQAMQGAAGPVQSVSAAGVSTSFAGYDGVNPGSASDAWYSKTVYGQEFLMLRNNVIAMGVMAV